MDQQEAYNRFGEIKTATEPENLGDLSREKLEEYYSSLHSLREWLHGTTWVQRACDERMELLWRKIEQKRLDAQHKENKRIAIAGIVVAALVGLAIAWWNHNTSQQQNVNTQPTKTPAAYNPTSSPTPQATALRVPSRLPTDELVSPSPPTAPIPSNSKPAFTIPDGTNIVVFNASRYPDAHVQFSMLMRSRFPTVIIDFELSWMNQGEMPNTVIYYIRPEFRQTATELASWLPGQRYVVDYTHQDANSLPFINTATGSPYHMAGVDAKRDIAIFVGNDFKFIIAAFKR